ncbi:uncharacterized protein DUF4221 [Algoriphagus aquaeductus]|uniref:Uncharacterized protein DUF4221 n=1 Tax=Algoriphagus aquaeductus TaxID=475299 RepID=A0A326RVG5_9BACT|nr:DUF4221 family protein [Algoriphagus aquaeductus]PZV86246.1 uncharacterized protein DUF4221 [Algoriphagus aquaeductus]
MKKLFLFLLAPFIFSCGGNTSEKAETGNILENLTFAVDTIVMDPGDQVVNVQFGPSLFGLSPDQKRYYFMHRNSGELTVFDLDEKKWIKKIQFEKDGPNAIPNFVYGFQLFDENRFLILDSRDIAVYDSSAVKVSSIPFGKDKFQDLTEEEGYSLVTGMQADQKKQLFVSLPNDPEKERISLAIWENANSQSRLVLLPEFGFLTKFTLIFQEGNSFSAAGFASQNLKVEKDRLLAFSSGTSSIYTYDLGMDSLSYKTYSPKLIPSQAATPEVSKFSTKESFDEGIKLAQAQIFFGDLLWDESRGIYLRFASITKPVTNPELPKRSEVFLLAFDRELNLIGESKVEELPSQPSWPFFKDGKLWSYVNVADELGFAVIDFKF